VEALLGAHDGDPQVEPRLTFLGHARARRSRL
jgi:hypothetical protein